MRYYLFCLLLFVGVLNSAAQNVGVNTPTPNSTLDVNGALSLREVPLPLANGDNNNVAIGNRSFFRITGPTNIFAVTGLADGVDGKIVTLYNATAFAITIRNLNSNSVAANQIKTLSGGDIIFPAGNSSITLQYSIAESKWIATSQQSVALNQSAATTFGTGNLLVNPASSSAVIPGLTQTIIVPAGAVVYVSSNGGIGTTATTATGFSAVDVFLTVDGSVVSNGGYARVYAANTGGVLNMISNWSLTSAFTLTAGSHTFAVSATGVSAAGASPANVSGTNVSPNQGSLTVMVLKR